MNKNLNFLSKLQNHEVKPPATLFDAIKQRIAQVNDDNLDIKFKELSTFFQAPPLNLEIAIKNNLAGKKLILIKGTQPVSSPFDLVSPILNTVGSKNILVIK